MGFYEALLDVSNSYVPSHHFQTGVAQDLLQPKRVTHPSHEVICREGVPQQVAVDSRYAGAGASPLDRLFQGRNGQLPTISRQE